MKSRIKKIYVIAAIALFASTWIPYKMTKLYGDYPNRNKALQTFDHFLQEKLEKKWERHFGLRDIFVRTKNTLYDWMNFGMFHSSFNRNIFEGKNDYLFVGDNITTHFCTDSRQCNTIAKNNVSALAQVQHRLKKLGIPVMFVMYPNKATTLPDDWPFMWDLMRANSSAQFNWYETYAKELTSNNIPFINLWDSLKKNQKNYILYSKGDSHWSLTMAALSLPYFFNAYGHLTGGAYHVPDIILGKAKRSSGDGFAALANTFNINSKETYTEFNFKPYSGQQTEFILYGDSYGDRFKSALVQSKMVSEKDFTFYMNKNLSKEDIQHILKVKKPLVFAYTYRNLATDRIGKECRNILDLLDTISPSN